MVNLGTFAAAALIAGSASSAAVKGPSRAYTAPTPPSSNANATFNLETLAYSGDLSYSGMFFVPVHSGAGSNCAEAAFTQFGAGGLNFNTTNGDIYAPLVGGEDYEVFSVGFSGGPSEGIINDSWPANYAFMGFNIGWANAGFEFNPANNQIKPNSFAGKTIEICPLWGIPETVGGPLTKVYGLMSRDNAVTARNASCAEVHLKAIYDV